MSFVIKRIGNHRRRLASSSGHLAPSCIFLTATIAPPQVAVARSDPKIRLRDYLTSLEFYNSLPSAIIDRILFVDNSGSDIGPIEEFVRSRINDKTVEIISFQGNEHAISHGKAYGEFKLLDFGLQHTALLSTNDRFWKVTGRLRVLNLVDLIASVRTPYDVLCDLHNFPWIGTGKTFANHWMDLRLFSCTYSAYQKVFAGKYEELGPLINQQVLYDIVMASRIELNILPRFTEQPILAGISGRHERDYHTGVQKIKTLMRGCIRKTVPSIWI